LFLFSISYSQNYTEKQTDSLQYAITDFLKDNGEYQKLIVLNRKTIDGSKKIKYTKGIIKGYINIADALLSIENSSESLRFLQLAEKQEEIKKSNNLLCELYMIYGKNYETLGLYDKANQNFSKAIYYGRRIKDLKPNRILAYTYLCKAQSEAMFKFADSVFYYLHKAYRIENSPLMAANLSIGHLMFNHADSSDYYIKHAYSELGRSNDFPNPNSQKGVVLSQIAQIGFQNKQYEKALESNLYLLEYYKKLKRPRIVASIYFQLSKIYDSLKNKSKTEEYFIKFAKLDDSIIAAQNPALNASISHFLKEQEQQNESGTQKLYYIIGIIIAVFCLLSILLYWFYKKRKKQEHVKIQHLEKKVDASYDEVMTLAKNNDPAFLGRFREVYPEFCDKLLEINPSLINNELKFCALLFLNLSTKEIATYTFVQAGTVRVRKNRIRKKLNILSDEDINIWMNNIVN